MESVAWEAPTDLDPECLTICEALNQAPGIQTFESCCGHGKRPFSIYFGAESLGDLPLVAWAVDGCHCGHYGWRIVAITDCGMCPISFVLEGPSGEESFEQADDIAGTLLRVLAGEE